VLKTIHKKGYLLFFLVNLLFSFSQNLLAQGPNKKIYSSREASGSGTYDFSFQSSLDTFISENYDSSKYDPITISQMARLKQQAVPYWHPENYNDDYDVDITKRVTEKALVIQSAHHISGLLSHSELQQTFHAMQRWFKSVKDQFNYSVQTNGEGYNISRSVHGEKLLELDIEFNLKQGVDPQIRVGKYMRFRYDYTYNVTFLEYTLNF